MSTRQYWAIYTYRMEQALRGRTDLDFLKGVFGKLTSNFGWGSTARTASGAVCLRAASSAWTISACSIAARRCRPEVIWNRPMGRDGSLCSVKTWQRLPSSLRLMIGRIERLASNCRSIHSNCPRDESCRRGRVVGRAGRFLL